MRFLFSVAFLAAAVSAMTPLTKWNAPSEEIEGEYVIQFKPEAREEFQSFRTKRSEFFSGIMNFYDFGDFMGFSAHLNEKELLEVQAVEGLLSVEPNIKMYALGTQSPATWGIDRSDQRSGTNNQYRWRDDAAGQNVTVFVLDTGIYTGHSNFGGRASFGADCTGSSCTTGSNTNDPQGHGTHCAGTVMSTTYGIAKQARAVNIRVLNASGSGSTAGIINGIQFVVQRYSGKRIISMSLGGGISTALDNAVNSAYSSGVLSVCAAGNNNNNACNGSPGRAANAYTVAASDSADRKASFSSYGSCVQLWAPGVSITSTSNSGGTAVFSGTSMATPHVAGAAALIASRGNYSPAQIASLLNSEATTNVISGNPSGTPNRLLFTNPL